MVRIGGRYGFIVRVACVLAALIGPLMLMAFGCGNLTLPVGEDGPLDASRDVQDAPLADRADAKGADALDSGGRLDMADVTDSASGIDVPFLGGLDGSLGVISAQVSCTLASGWSWCNPLPTGVSLDAVWGSDANHVWAVGAGGVAEFFDGTSWTVVSTPTQLELFSVWGADANDVWAVGSNAYGSNAEVATSVILFWNGSAWTVEETLPGVELWSVWGSSATNVWAVGSNATTAEIAQFDGASWTASANSLASVLYGVAGSSAGNVWAVGAIEVHPDGSTMAGTPQPAILETDGSAPWTLVLSAPSGLEAIGIWVASDHDAWVATRGSPANTPLHWDGAMWNQVSAPGSPTAFGGTAGSDVWGTAGTSILHWTGSSWSADAVGGIGRAGTHPVSFAGVWSSATTSAWAVGTGGALAELSGATWSTNASMQELLATWASSGEAWAVGRTGTALHWTGQAWSPTTIGTVADLVAVWGASPTDVWSIDANSNVFVWGGDAGGWTPTVSPSTEPLLGISGTSATDVWISNTGNNTGDGGAGAPTNTGKVFHWGGSSWTANALPLDGGKTCFVNALWANTPGDVWGVGYSLKAMGVIATAGVVVHFDGSAWTLADTPFSSAGGTVATSYAYVWGSSTDDVWVSGSAAGSSSETAVLIHWNGKIWENATLPSMQAPPGALWGTSSDDAWLVASFSGDPDQELLHWDGTGWAPSFTIPDSWGYGNALAGSAPGDLWAVGAGGMILHHQ